MSLIRNAQFAAATAAQHLGDDPVLLTLQVSRRLPVRVVRGVAHAMRLLPISVPQAMGAHLLGMNDARNRVIDGALTSKVSRVTAARLADVALAANEPIRSDRLLAKAGSAAGTRARRRWYDGDMTGAIAELSSAGLHRKAQRLQSELRVFQGWTPSLSPVPVYTPKDRTVLHILTNSLPHTGSGYAQRSHSILKAQSELGWSVHAATRLGYPVQVGKLLAKDQDELDCVTYHRLLPDTLPAGFDERLQVQAEAVLQVALMVRPAVLHTTTHFVNGLVTRAVAEALGIPWVYEVRGQLADTWASTRSDVAKASERYKLFTECEAAVMRSAPLIVTLGEAMKQQILNASGGFHRAVLLLPNAVGDNFLDPPISSRVARERLGLPREGVFVGTVSSLVDYEGLDDLIRAVALLLPNIPTLKCLIVGDGISGPSLQQLARDLGVASHVTFTGRVPRDQAPLYHRALDVFVVPRRDSDVTRTVTPLKPVEAMAAGRPVVASDLPALREIVEDGVTGILVRPGDVSALSSALMDLMDSSRKGSSNTAANYGSAGRQRVLARRTWGRNARTLVGAYGDLGVAG